MHGSNKLPVIPEKEEFPIALSADKAENTPRNPPFMTDRCPHPNEKLWCLPCISLMQWENHAVGIERTSDHHWGGGISHYIFSYKG